MQELGLDNTHKKRPERILIGRSELEIFSLGARIGSLKLNGKSLLFDGLRGDGKHASTHPCSPIFGPETTTHFDLPWHGPMRNAQCILRRDQNNDLIVVYNVSGIGKYPEGLTVMQRFHLENYKFVLRTIHMNSGKEDVPVNFGEHFYFLAPKGYKGLIINGEDVTGKVENNQVISLGKENRIEIPGQEPFLLRQQGFGVANLWAHIDPKTREADRGYVCIEPVEGDPNEDFFGSQASLIKSHGARSTEIILQLV